MPLMDRPAYENLLTELHAARLEGPVDRLVALFAPDVRFRIVGASDGRPIAINAQGEQGVRPWLAMLLKTFRLTEYCVLSITIDGRHATVHWTVNIHSRITGSMVATELVDMVEVRDRKIVSYTELFVPR